MILVDGGERVLDVPQRGVEDELNDAALLVGEERGERVVDVAVIAIEEADDLGKIGAQHLCRLPAATKSSKLSASASS